MLHEASHGNSVSVATDWFRNIYVNRWRRQWHLTPVLLPGKSHGWRSLIGYSPWGREESDRTEQLHFHALQKEMATHSSVFAWRIPYHKAVRTLLVSSPSALALTHSE